MDQLHSLVQAPYLLDISCTSSLFWDLLMLLFYVMHFKTQRFLRQMKKTETTKKQNDIGRIESSSIKKTKQKQKTYHSVYGALS